MTRRLLNLVTALSLLLCVAVCVLWLRSHRVTDVVALATADTIYQCHTGRGVFVLQATAAPGVQSGWWIYPARDAIRHRNVWQRIGFYGYAADDIRTVMIPWSLLAGLALAGAMPGAVTFAAARLRQRDGHCPRCGYDLRATPGRCPECGTANR
jgi:hypothetical protein